MIVSIDWLKEFVDITESPEELADVLSSIVVASTLNTLPKNIFAFSSS